MANAEQLAILHRGVEAWNRWRKENISIYIDLSQAKLLGATLQKAHLGFANLSGSDFSEAKLNYADFEGANLNRVNLSQADLIGVNLEGANLVDANLSEANLIRANFRDADLTGADFKDADAWQADLSEADLSNADLTKASFREATLKNVQFTNTTLRETDFWEADLTYSDLTRADLSFSELGHANLSEAKLKETNFLKTRFDATVLGNINLSEAIGLAEAVHQGPSIIGANTLTNSKGTIPEVFLKGCGLSDIDIEFSRLFRPELTNAEINEILYKIYDLRASQAIQISPLFISYSRVDSEFVDKIGEALTQKGIRYWRDLHDMRAGRVETQIDYAIRQNPTVLLVLSKHSVNSDWVEHEVRLARRLEKETGRDVFCPVALDASWERSPWPQHIMEQIMKYNILDFSEWWDNSKFEGMFRRLIDGLELFYKR